MNSTAYSTSTLLHASSSWDSFVVLEPDSVNSDVAEGNC